MGIVADEFEVFVLEVEETLYIGIDFHLRQGTWLTGKLETGLLDVVQIEMRVAGGMNEVAGLIACHLRHHLQQKRVGGDVKRYTEERICRTLIKLQRQTVACHIELEDGVTGRQGHLVDLGHIPCRDNHTTGVGIVFQLIEHILYLIDGTALIVRPRAPLVTIDGTQFAIFISPLIPDTHPMLLQVFHVGIALQEPEQFVDDRLQVKFLRGQQGESVVEVIARLGAEDADGTCACTVTFLCAFCQDAVQDV